METIRKYKTILKNKKKGDPSVSPRSYTGELVYLEARKRGLTKPLDQEEVIRSWQNWRLIDNAFPYDIMFKKHHMLIPNRVVQEKDLNNTEKEELRDILSELSQKYDCRLVNFPRNQSIKKHFHIHLLVFKDSRADLTIY